MDYYEYIRKYVYTPATMSNSDHFSNNETLSNKAIGYYIPRDGKMKKLISNQKTLGRLGCPAGGGYASANDLLNFSTALLNNELIDNKHRELMTSSKVPMGWVCNLKYFYRFKFMVMI